MSKVNERLEALAQEIVLGKQNFLFIGPSGSGKTYAAGMLNPPTLFINTEGGLRTIARQIDNGSKEIDIRGKDRIWEYMVDELMPMLLEQTHYQTIAIDSLSGLSELYYRQVAGINPQQSHTLKNYGQTIDRLRQTVSTLNRAVANVIWITTEIAIVNDNGVVEQYIPNVAGKETFARQVPAHMDQVWFFHIKEETKTTIVNSKPKIERRTERVILTAPTGKKLGKDRDGVLELEEVLDFEELRRKLQLIQK